MTGQRGEIGVVISIDGDVAPGFERVRDVFGDNFERNGDVGAAICVYRHGRTDPGRRHSRRRDHGTGLRTRPVLLVPTRFASGFMLPTGASPLGGPASFGHPGRGGSLGFADPESGVAFGYVVSHIRQDLSDNRAGLLVQAVRACLE